MDIQASKIELIKMIADIESERLIEKLKKFLHQEIKNGKNGNAPSVVEEPEPEWMALAKQPMPNHLDLDQLAKEQGYDGKRRQKRSKIGITAFLKTKPWKNC